MLEYSPTEELHKTKPDPQNENDRVRFMEHLVHDMRSLLAPIQGFAEIIATSNTEDESIDSKNLSKVIAAQSFRLGKMIEDALVCTRILEDKFELHLEPVSIRPMLDSLVKEIRSQTDKIIEYEDHLGNSLIKGDLFYLRDAINRIIENALQNSKSKVRISTDIDPAPEHRQARIWVEDDGIEIAEVDIPALFTLFGRFQGRQSRGSSGNGMGLFIANTIVDRHNGKVVVRSNSGTNTVFILTLPILTQ